LKQAAMATTTVGGPVATRHEGAHHHGIGMDGTSNLEKDVHKEYHDPYDDWSARDILLSLVPFVITYAFKDSALRTAVTFALAFSVYLLLIRTVWFDSKRKHVWPVLDITNVITFAVLRGLIGRYPFEIVKWWNVILPAIFALVGIISLLRRRPFTAHYARYPKFDRGGHGLWQGDSSYHRTSDLNTLGWITAWVVMLFLSLIPILTDNWIDFHVLNIIFNYVVPFVLLAFALVFHQSMGTWYRNSVARSTTTTTAGYGRGAGYPSGATAAPVAGATTYSNV